MSGSVREADQRGEIVNQFILSMKQLCEYHSGIWHMPSIRAEFEKHAKAFAQSTVLMLAEEAEENWKQWPKIAAWLREKAR